MERSSSFTEKLASELSSLFHMSQKRRKLLNLILLGCTVSFSFATLHTLSSESGYTRITWGHWKEHKFWPKDPECKIHSTRIAKVGSIPPRALVSYPGSGNTWIRYLIEGGSGIYTGSIFNDKSIEAAGHYGETRDERDGSTILQKTHHRSLYSPLFALNGLGFRKLHIQSFGGRGVVVVRNPFKAVLSYWNYWRTKSHTSTVDKTSLNSTQFKDFAYVGIARWYELIVDWLEYGSQVYFVFYEDLKDEPIKEIEKLLNYLGLEVDQSRLKCLQKDLTGSFHRTKHEENNPFSQDHQTIYRSMIESAREKILSATGQSLPLHKYQFYNTTKV